MDRKAILAALDEEGAASNLDLLRDIGSYLQKKPDKALVEQVEKRYGRTLAELQFTLNGGERPDFADVCRTHCSWLRTYLELTRANEAPGIFHAIAALTAASQAIGRRVWVPMGFYDVFPQLSAILAAPSGMRKTVALGTATKLLELANLPINIIRERFTPEALVLALKGPNTHRDEFGNMTITGATAFVVSPEMAVTLGRASYLEGLVPLITRLLDHEGYEVRTKGGGEIRLRDVGLGFLGATTPEWITDEMHIGVVSGGFTSRFLISYEKASPRVIYRFDGDIRAKLLALSEELVGAIHEAQGPVRLEPAADDFLEQWYRASKLANSIDDLTSGYYNRKQTHLVRLALVFSVLDRAPAITIEHLTDAITILDYIEPGMFELFRKLAKSQTASDADKVCDIIYKAGGRIRREGLLRIAIAYMPMGRFNEALAYLENSDSVELAGKEVRLRSFVRKLKGGTRG